MKRILYTAMICCGCFLTPSCVGDLDQFPHTEITSENIYNSAESYYQVLAKLYTAMVTTGQEQNGSQDLSSNKGFDYMRCYFNLQEVGTDEVAYTWLSGETLSDISNLSWDATDVWVSDMYYRIYYNIALCNEFLRHTTDDAIAAFDGQTQSTLRTYRAEARFLRALFYYHALDFFHDIPFVSENDPVGSYIPPRYTAQQIFDFIETELNEITGTENGLLNRDECPYGRASKGAAYTLLARMYLNAETYIGEARYTECITACNHAIEQGYTLEQDYAKLFNADNDKRTNEIIFTLPVDATTTVSWGASTYVVCAAVPAGMAQNSVGVASGWGSMRMRGAASAQFNNDPRGMFITEGQTLNITDMTNEKEGYVVTKWSNVTDAGETASNTAQSGVNTDFPLFRLADVYLMYAEATARGGQGGSMDQAYKYVNELRDRVGAEPIPNWAAMTNDNSIFFLAERLRELYWEGTRRTDLIRFNRFTSNTYVWEWKGGTLAGTGVDSKYNIYPIPSTELTANPNLYNENY